MAPLVRPALALIALLVLVDTTAARACYNGVSLGQREAVRLAAAVEGALHGMDYDLARRLFKRKQHRGSPSYTENLWDDAFDDNLDDQRLSCRVRLLRALARFRLDDDGVALASHLDSGGCWDDPATRTPSHQALVAEAEAADPSATVRARGRATLVDLATRDLVPTPEAWATLAQLHAEQGDNAAAGTALRRCRREAPRPAVCERLAARRPAAALARLVTAEATFFSDRRAADHLPQHVSLDGELQGRRSVLAFLTHCIVAGCRADIDREHLTLDQERRMSDIHRNPNVAPALRLLEGALATPTPTATLAAKNLLQALDRTRLTPESRAIYERVSSLLPR